ncbi:MAG: hypothetical protein JSR45_05590 [Proteobacteria bacterium]|nr:hypothetical protein [Pseudomonadota bacterium]
MSAVILGKPDTLDEVGRRFERARLTQPLFLNSAPKSGTHLLRNIMRMFVAEDQHWRREYVQHALLGRSREAFDPTKPMVSWGHLLFSDDAAIAVKPARHLLLVRDPYDWVLARARFYLSDEFQGPTNQIKGGAVPIEDVLNMMILGVHQKVPTLLDVYSFNVAAWMGTAAVLVKFEALKTAVQDLGSRRSEAFFAQLMADAGVGELPADWRERVEAGADPAQSRTARANLNVDQPIPEVLPEAQKRLVDFAAPGLRALLGYL